MGQQGREARLKAAQKSDGNTCVWCRAEFGHLIKATTEHLIPRVKGGPSWVENEVAACRRCNGQRGHRDLVAWLEECERRGWAPDVERLLSRLTNLELSIQVRGGQRRARPQLASQLRRLRKHGIRADH